MKVSRPCCQAAYFWARNFFHRYSLSISLFPFNPFSHCSLVLCTRVAQVLCFVVPMQSSFSVRDMDSASEPPSSNMAATTSAKQKFRKCLRCPSRMPSFDFDNHTLCTKCRNQVCDLEIVCDECRDWPLQKRNVFVSYNRGLKARREYKKRKTRLAGAASSDQSLFRQNTYLQNKYHMLTCQGGTGCYRF